MDYNVTDLACLTLMSAKFSYWRPGPRRIAGRAKDEAPRCSRACANSIVLGGDAFFGTIPVLPREEVVHVGKLSH